MSNYYGQAPKKPERIVILRKWYCVFMDNIDSDMKLGVNDAFMKLKKDSGSSNKAIRFLGSFCIVGEVYGGDYPDGHRIGTHIIKSMQKVTDPVIVGKIRRSGSDTVLRVTTVREEKYYLCLSSNGTIFGGNN